MPDWTNFKRGQKKVAREFRALDFVIVMGGTIDVATTTDNRVHPCRLLFDVKEGAEMMR